MPIVAGSEVPQIFPGSCVVEKPLGDAEERAKLYDDS